ncbi:MAG: hypothetical protein E6Q90_12715 [Actinobacteria bacterium]|nr:MAG: hypothetical protein E6Q90_12715 [Actinomycetota bacterium]
MNWGDVPTWLGIIAAVLVAAWAARIARQTRDETRRQADRAADANRLAHQANRIAEEALKLSQDAARTHVGWEVRHERNNTYVLLNVGTGSAFDVALEYAGVLDILTEASEVKPQESVRFMAFAPSGGTDQTITVTYSNEANGERHTKSFQKPGHS